MMGTPHEIHARIDKGSEMQTLGTNKGGVSEFIAADGGVTRVLDFMPHLSVRRSASLNFRHMGDGGGLVSRIPCKCYAPETAYDANMVN
jgi:hypothetical protein